MVTRRRAAGSRRQGWAAVMTPAEDQAGGDDIPASVAARAWLSAGKTVGGAMWRTARRYPFATLIIGATVLVTAVYHHRPRETR